MGEKGWTNFPASVVPHQSCPLRTASTRPDKSKGPAPSFFVWSWSLQASFNHLGTISNVLCFISIHTLVVSMPTPHACQFDKIQTYSCTTICLKKNPPKRDVFSRSILSCFGISTIIGTWSAIYRQKVSMDENIDGDFTWFYQQTMVAATKPRFSSPPQALKAALPFPSRARAPEHRSRAKGTCNGKRQNFLGRSSGW